MMHLDHSYRFNPLRERVFKGMNRRRENRHWKFSGLEGLEQRQLLAADPVLSEFVAVNSTTLQDEDGDYSDWLELENRGDMTADLSGYYLTDDPADLTKWQIPTSTTLDAGEFLVIFASAKDRTTAGNELHTNFTIDELGGDLALVAPNGTTIVSSFLNHPAMGPDQAYASYRPSGDADYIADDADVKFLVPSDGSLGTNWTGAVNPFNDSAFTQAPQPVGYDTSQTSPDFRVEAYYSTTAITNLAQVDAAIGGANLQPGSPHVGNYQTVNFLDTLGGATSGNFVNDVVFPGDTAADDNNFAIKATTTFFIRGDQSGDWTFGFNSDDGGRVRVDGVDVVVDDTNHANADFFGTINLAGGQHTLEYVMWDQTGGAAAELFAAQGAHTSFSNAFSLVGDPNGSLPLTNLDALVATDVEADMLGTNASIYLRNAFTVANPEDVTSLTLNATFDDGAVIYLNGTRVYAENAPATPAFNSTATKDAGLLSRRIDLTPYLGTLRAGDNVVAVHGLNAGVNDTEYFAQVELFGRAYQGEVIDIVDIATPGGANGRVDPVITEFQADNKSTIDDEDGDSSDWIEVHNPGTVDVVLTGWYLTDNQFQLNKWRFPETVLQAGEYLVVFASGKDRGGLGEELHTNFSLDADGEYVALVRPDGTTVQWEYEIGGQNYGPQFPDVSFGLEGGAVIDDGTPMDTDPVRGLVAYWDFEDGTGSSTVADRSGNGVVGTLTNMDPATDWIQGRSASTRAISFDGVNDTVTTGMTASDLGFPGATQRTVAGWVRGATTGPTSRSGGVFEIGSSPNNDYALRTQTAVNFLWINEVGSSTVSTTVFPGGAWLHFATVYDGVTASLYINGNLVGSAEAPGLDTDDLVPFTMGHHGTAFFRGDIDELAVWDMALTSDVVSDLASGSLTPLTVPTVNRPLGVNRDGFEVRQVNASATFAGSLVGQVRSLADADSLLALPDNSPGVEASATFTRNDINMYDDAGGGDSGLFGNDRPFLLDDEIDNDDQFAISVLATLVVPEGEAGDFVFGVHSDDGSRLRIDGVDVIVDNAIHVASLQTGTINLSEGEHTLELVYFENTGGAELELLYASSTGGQQDGDFQLLEILPDQRTPEAPPTVFAADRVFFPAELATPGAPNTAGVAVFIGPTAVSVPHGFYDAPFQLQLSNATPNVDIYYTLDGTEPSPENGSLYNGPITISGTTTIRAAGFQEDAAPSRVTTASYLFIDDILTQSPTGTRPDGVPTNWNPGNTQSIWGMDPDIVNSPVWGPQMEAALTQIPTMSIVMDLEDIFGPQGIYTQAGNRGQDWERPSSLELIYPDGTGPDDGFTVNAGIRVRGGFSRSNDNPKHAFRFFFRAEYGDSKLNYDLFDEAGTDQFDKIDLRTSQNYSWAFQNDGRNNFLRDVVSRDMMGALGQPTTRGDYYHVYVNGMYWGLFQTEERPGADYAAANFGGDEEDWDVIHNEIGQRQLAAIDGEFDAHTRLFNAFQAGLGDDNMEAYYRLQGMNPDGTRNSAYERLLDVDNLIDYMFTTYFTSDADGPGSMFTRPQVNNYYAMINRENPDGFKFLEHDSEHSFDTGNAASANYNMVSPFVTGQLDNVQLINAHSMFQELANTNSDFRQRFIDKFDEATAPGGPLHEDSIRAMLQQRADEISLAIIAESARWGDAKRATPFTKTDWDNAVQNTLNWVVGRNEQLRNQFRCAGDSSQGGANPNPATCTPAVTTWYPEFKNPVITPPAGPIAGPTDVTLNVPGNLEFTDTVRGNSGVFRWHIPTNDSLGLSWTQPNFNSLTWTLGTLGIGYDDDTGYEAYIGPNAMLPGRDANGANGTIGAYVRPLAPFTIPDTDDDGNVIDEFDSLTLRVRYDDGFIAYLNGVRIASANAPATPAFNSIATGTHDDGAAVVFEDFVIGPEGLAALHETGNWLAFHSLNAGDTSSDMLLGWELVARTSTGQATSSAQIYYTVDGSDPRASGNGLSSNAIPYNATVSYLDSPESGKYIIADGDASENGWQNLGYNDASWGDTTFGIGFDEDPEGTVDTGEPGFLIRTVNVSSPQIADGNIATDILDGTIAYTAISETTRIDPYVNHGTNGAGQFTNPVDLMPPGLTGDTEDYAVRASAKVTIPAGTYTLAVSSDDGFRMTIPNVSFTSTSNENGNNGVGTDTFAFIAVRGVDNTLATFTTPVELNTTIQLDFYERGGGDSVELSIANGAVGSFSTGTFQILQDGTLGWDLEAAGVVINAIDYAPVITNDVSAELFEVPGSVYMRFPFTVSNAAALTNLKLDAKYDDGLAIFVNGELAATVLAPDPSAFDSVATGSRADNLSLISSTIDLSDALPFLVDGENVLAIQLLKESVDDTDLLFIPGQLTGTFGGQPFQVSENTLVRVRAFEDGVWSSIQEAFYQVDTPTLAITELNYNPYDPTADELAAIPTLDADDFEFIEIQNNGTEETSLAGVEFSEGINFSFPSVTLAPGEYGVVVRNAAAFEMRYGTSINVLGVIASGSLANGGERVTLVDGTGAPLASVSYSDANPWPQRADGDGGTLELRFASTDPALYDKYYSWKGSTNYGGSPGSAGDAPSGVVISEVLSHTDPPLPHSDSIELHNTTGSPIDISGWYLSDAGGSLLKFRVPDGTVVGPGRYVVFNESDFNPTPLTPGPNDFALNGANGDDVYLVISDGADGVLSIQDDVHFGAAANGETLGRDATGRFVPLARNTLGYDNSNQRIGPVIISEINYDPGLPSAAALAIDPNLTANDLEFVEIHNPTTAAVDLTNWRIRGGADYNFDDGLMLGAGGTVVVIGFNPDNPLNADRVAAFRAHYGIGSSVVLVGGLSGQLSDGGERIQLQRPDEPPVGDPNNTPDLFEDEVLYDNLAPWATGAAGTGNSLQREAPSYAGHVATSFSAATATPGSVAYIGGIAGDLNGDGALSAEDIDILYDMINAGSEIAFADLNSDSQVDSADVTHLVENLIGSLMGDANLDFVVDGSDFNLWNAHKFVDIGASWSQGNFDGEAGADGSDFNLWFANRFTAGANGAQPAASGTPRAALGASEIVVGGETINVITNDGLVETPKRDSVDAGSTGEQTVAGETLRLRARTVDRRGSRDSGLRVRRVTEQPQTDRFTKLVDDLFADWS